MFVAPLSCVALSNVTVPEAVELISTAAALSIAPDNVTAPVPALALRVVEVNCGDVRVTEPAPAFEPHE